MIRWREAVLWKLRWCGIEGRLWQDVERVFGKVQSAVRMNGRVSKFVKLMSGLKQGGVLSPWLFALFMDDLVKELLSSGWGDRMECEDMVVLLFVDDVVLIQESVEKAQRLVNIVYEWGRSWGMVLSASKSGWMSNVGGGNMELGGEVLPRVRKMKYLGVMLQESTGWSMHEKWQLGKLRRRVWGIRRMMAEERCWGTMDGLRMWDVMVRPLVWWAIGGWRPTKNFMEKVNRIKRGLVKEWLGVAITASNVGVEAEVGMWRSEDEVMKLKLEFWRRLKMSKSDIIKKLLEGSEIERWVKQTKMSSGLTTSIECKEEWKAGVERAVLRVIKRRWNEEKQELEKMDMWREMDSGWGMKWWVRERSDGWRSYVKMRLEDRLMIERVGKIRSWRGKIEFVLCVEKVLRMHSIWLGSVFGLRGRGGCFMRA